MPKAGDNSTDLPLTARQRAAFRRKLLAWFAQYARDLPWRRSRDPYRVWLSEVMLQQTTVAAVKPYFERFVAAFPRVEDLAAADEQTVLRMWEGLGYYRRARGLLAAARKLVAEMDGEFPRDVPTLMTLPGVGRYTAGAVASIAFDAKAPIVEANTIRVLSRLIGYRDDPLRSAGQKLLWRVAEELLPERDVARFNQGMMELGSLVCTVSEPKCGACPVAAYCEANRLGLQHDIPAASRKPEFTAVREAAVLVRQNGAVLMRQCPAGERWEGLWDFPRFPVEAEGPLFIARELAEKVRAQTGVAVAPGPLVKTIKHGVTRYRITLECYRAERTGGRIRSTAARPVRWTPLGDLAELPLSVTGRKLAALAP